VVGPPDRSLRVSGPRAYDRPLPRQQVGSGDEEVVYPMGLPRSEPHMAFAQPMRITKRSERSAAGGPKVIQSGAGSNFSPSARGARSRALSISAAHA
jgi:hypothetical protein